MEKASSPSQNTSSILYNWESHLSLVTVRALLKYYSTPGDYSAWRQKIHARERAAPLVVVAAALRTVLAHNINHGFTREDSQNFFLQDLPTFFSVVSRCTPNMCGHWLCLTIQKLLMRAWSKTFSNRHHCIQFTLTGAFKNATVQIQFPSLILL